MRVEVVEGIDTGALWHSGDPIREQRTLSAGDGFVDLSHYDLCTIEGVDRLTWLHALTTQHLTNLAPGQATTAFVLSPTGHIEHGLEMVDDGTRLWVHTAPGHGEALLTWLESMKFMSRVEMSARPDAGLLWTPRVPEDVADLLTTGVLALRACPWGGTEVFFEADARAAVTEQLGDEAGMWAYTALRVAAGYPRFGVDTDHRTIPNEIGLVGTHLDKGCYRGQETVARVHTLGRPPRRLVRLLLDGSVDVLPPTGSPVANADREIGFVGSVAQHWELGPVALALVKRNVPVDATLTCGPENEVSAAQEVLVDPDVGLHVRARL
ncbi:YgfZ/GcvT domain-containing protein [Enemella sp. A6]|uniref:CAF17-like 4Fe-4S cluster assembly/insertion protein YgfZ n=1 Tax=Enemella sp. A6 TaxID=3440152 RepID=UPI003EBB92A4